MRLLLVALLLASVCGASCLSSCDGVGAIGSMVQGDMQHGAARGDMAAPVDADEEPAVVGIVWPFEPTILLEFGKETTFTDGDPIETPTNFGSDSAVGLTQGTLGSRPQFQTPCDVGPAVSCAYFDAGDSWVEALARAALAYMHDGTGMTCYVVVEFVGGTAADSVVISTGGWGATDRGFLMSYSSSTTDRLRGYASNNTAYIFGGQPTGGVFGDDATRAAAVVHGTARDTDVAFFWRGSTSAATGNTANYAATPDIGDPDFPLTIGKRAGGAGGQLTGYLFAIACEDAIHDATMISNTWAAIEAVTGALPQ